MWQYRCDPWIGIMLGLALVPVAHGRNASAQDPYTTTETVKVDGVNPGNPGSEKYPGGRGPNELVVYTPEHGPRTGTNSYGIEATVVKGFVESVGGNNSPIPADGLVVSGHGDAARWIATHLSQGKKVVLRAHARELVVVTDSQSHLENLKRMLTNAQRRLAEVAPPLSAGEEKRFREIESRAAELISHVTSSLNEAQFDEAQPPLKRLDDLVEEASLIATRSPEVETRGFWDRITARSPQEVATLMEDLEAHGVNCYLPETYYGGESLSPSELVPQHEAFRGWDPLAAVIEQGHRRGIEVHAWVHDMHVGRAGSPLVKAHPDWLMRSRRGRRFSTLEPGYHYFSWCHPQARRMLLDYYRELVKEHPTLDGLHLDYIRFPVTDPEGEDFDYCDACRSAYRKEYGMDPIEITPRNRQQWRRWCAWREKLVDDFVGQVSMELRGINPKLKLSAAVFMPLDEARRTKYQNWGLWTDKGWLDFICPMIYTLDPYSVATQTAEMVRRVGGKAHVFPGIGAYLGIPPMTLLRQVSVARDAGAQGVVLFSWRGTRPQQRRVLKLGPFRRHAIPVDARDR